MEFKEFWKFSSFLMIYVYKYRKKMRALALIIPLVSGLVLPLTKKY